MVQLYPHQLDALKKLHNGAILWGDVGTGKSLVAAAYYMRNEAPRDVYVITTAKKRDSLDWESDFVKYGVGKERDATVAGVLTVDSWNNLGRYRDVKNAFFIFDEQRIVGSGEWSKFFIKIAHANTWILLSATPGDTWMDYIPVFIANGFYRNRTEFKREHVIYNSFAKFPKVDRYVGVGRLVRLRNQILVEMPYLRRTTRHSYTIPVECDTTFLEEIVKKRWNPFEERPMKDVGEMFRVVREIVNSDASRVHAVKTLMEAHPRLIVFYNFDYELESLRSLISPLNSSENQIQSSPNTSEDNHSSEWNESIEEIDLPWNTDNSSDTRSELDSTTLVKSPSFIANQDGETPWQTQKPVDTTSSCPALMNELTNRTPTVVAVTSSSPSKCEKDEATSTTSTTTSGSTVQLAEWNGHKHQPIPDGERWLYLVQYAAGSEGWNCTSTNAMVFYSLPYSYKQWHQAHGRIDRLNTTFTDLHFYSLVSHFWIDKLISKVLESKQNFNESAYNSVIWNETDIKV